MRTKALLLSAAIGLVGSASLMAQTNVYSLNAVGYVNLTIPPGWSMISCQLIATNNQIQYLIPNPPTNGAPFYTGAYDDLQIAKYNGSGFNTAVGDGGSYDGVSNFGWDNGQYTLNPGEGGFIHNSASVPIILTFVGQVPQGTNSVPMTQGYNLVSSPVPQAGGITSVLGLEPSGIQYYGQSYIAPYPIGGGDQLAEYSNGSGNYSTQVEDDYSGNGTALNPPGSNPTTTTYSIPWDTEPTPVVGESFWYKLSPINGQTMNWTRVFSVNN